MLLLREDSMLEVEVGVTAVQMPQPGLRARSRYSSGIEYLSAYQHKGRPPLGWEPEYVCRQHAVGIVLYSNRPAVQVVCLSVVRVAVARLEANVFIEEKTIATQKAV